MAASEQSPILVTGAGGFVGNWLIPELRGSGHAVVALCKPDVPHAEADAHWIDVDLRDRDSVSQVIKQVRPAAVLHLAAIAVPREASRDPEEALRVNFAAVDHLIHAICTHAPDARLLYVSSGEVYGRQSADLAPLRETEPLAPENLYAATKAAAEQLVVLACERSGLDAVRARPFNHSGPGRPSDYAESTFARQVAELERSSGDRVVRVGNLDAQRDYSDVRDVVRAYRLLIERGERGAVYNVCSGHGRSIRSVLEHLLSRARRPLEIEVDPARFEPADPQRIALVGNPAAIRALGWEPTYSFESTLDALLEDWRGRM